MSKGATVKNFAGTFSGLLSAVGSLYSRRPRMSASVKQAVGRMFQRKRHQGEREKARRRLRIINWKVQHHEVYRGDLFGARLEAVRAHYPLTGQLLAA